MLGFSAEYLIIVLFGLVIVFLLYVIYAMQQRMRTLLVNVDQMNSTIHYTCNKLDTLSKDVEEFNKK
ncbi:MAG: hypothetical protein IK060_01510 [Methanomicrobium sp.]|nr:hypothetical protein [Methanomicrobium sp.]MBO4522287.1 hypothetical protein [Methanomicrobium sp.]MBR6011010.1 hypothetical protein [Methanomicrobium sp.]MBR6447412.1 hypothetical protein [Methanomicrobium sp.]MBR6496768.1 hypothetical protein [Methanomicrobium sp.]